MSEKTCQRKIEGPAARAVGFLNFRFVQQQDLVDRVAEETRQEAKTEVRTWSATSAEISFEIDFRWDY